MSRITTSLFGKRLGFDKDGYLTNGESTAGGGAGAKITQLYVGASGLEVAQFGSTSMQVLTSASTGTQILAGGYTQINSSNALTYTLAPPVPSVWKVISAQSTAASGAVTVRLSTVLGGNFISTLGSSFQAVAFIAAGSAISMIGISTAYYQILTNTSSAAITT